MQIRSDEKRSAPYMRTRTENLRSASMNTSCEARCPMPIVMSMSERPLRIVGTHEIRSLLGGVSRQRVWQITSREDFPKPVARLSQGKVWLADDVEEWRAKYRSFIDFR